MSYWPRILATCLLISVAGAECQEKSPAGLVGLWHDKDSKLAIRFKDDGLALIIYKDTVLYKAEYHVYSAKNLIGFDGITDANGQKPNLPKSTHGLGQIVLQFNLRERSLQIESSRAFTEWTMIISGDLKLPPAKGVKLELILTGK